MTWGEVGQFVAFLGMVGAVFIVIYAVIMLMYGPWRWKG